MDKEKTKHLTRDDWLKAALNLCVAGIDNVKVAPLATELGVTTGSFYWHFKNRQELLEALLKYWEYEMTDKAIEAAKRYEGSPTDRILFVMEKVMNNGLAHFDLPIWQWAQTDTIANRAFKRALKKRFSYATRMFSEAGFSREQAEIRGRMMVIYMMGESTLIPESMAKRKEFIKLKHTILTAPE
ncbi:MAG: TetR/AcrR family transcriptional regulator [Deltaproteobacteria bacterium]|nr:TetR/AcrR family transcriptional regulator [Deltaproteobacteria bacterium]